LRARHVRSEMARLDALFATEKAHAAGEPLVAGIFVSYGAAPDIARIDDPIFGLVKVAIAEKINESARGTARNAGVRERVEARRQAASRKAGRPLEMPFGVVVDVPSAVPLTGSDAVTVAELLAAGRSAEAEARLLAVVQDTLARKEDQGEILNT